MSLRAKIEAVIYAAEEPVTLAQLATLFAAELRAELEAVAQTPSAHSASDVASDPGQSADAAQEPPQTEAAASEPNSPPAAQPARVTERDLRAALRRLLDELVAGYAASDRGMEIREIAGGYRMATKPEYHDVVRGFVRSLKPPMKLSLPALETLAVVAYKQPVTAPEVADIRGVESAGVLGSLLARKLITTAGRKQVIGRPILYKTTREFLLRFGLKDLSELPSMEEFEKMAGALAESDEVAFAAPQTAPEAHENALKGPQNDAFPRTSEGDESQENPQQIPQAPGQNPELSE